MTSREIVQRALTFRNPPRLPVWFPSLGVSDAAGLPIHADPSFTPDVEGQDEWGCVWAKTDVPNMGQVKGHPLEDIRKLDDHRWPRFDQDERYIHGTIALDAADAEGKFASADIFMVLFERMHSLHGFENTLADLVLDRPAMEALADRIVEVQLDLIANVTQRFPGRLQGWSMTDDWGTQQAAFISLEMWMDFFLPRYRRIFDAMHAAGCTVTVHSCGKINELLEGFIAAGVDCVNLQQPRAMGIEAVGNRYRGRIAFSSLSDIQHTLPTGDRAKIQADAEALMQHWASPEGGFFFSDYGDDSGIGVYEPGTKRFMYDCFSRLSEEMYGSALPEPTVP